MAGSVSNENNRSSVRETSFFHTPDGKKLHSRYWKPSSGGGDGQNGEPASVAVPPVALVFICHGFAEHLEWYSELAEKLVEKGNFLAFGHDHRGHGLSDGKRARVDNVDQLVDDVFLHASKVPLFRRCYMHNQRLLRLRMNTKDCLASFTAIPWEDWSPSSMIVQCQFKT